MTDAAVERPAENAAGFLSELSATQWKTVAYLVENLSAATNWNRRNVWKWTIPMDEVLTLGRMRDRGDLLTVQRREFGGFSLIAKLAVSAPAKVPRTSPPPPSHPSALP